MSINAKEELLDRLKTNNKPISDIVIAKVGFADNHYNVLPEVFEDTEKLLDFLDRVYDNGFGSQELYGIILFNDNSWFERKEYDGADWWVHVIPYTKELVKELKW